MPSIAFPQRILIAGVSGVGKSTLARQVAEATGLPYTELDSLHHGPGWTRLESFEANVAAIAAGDRWVSEWQYSAVRPLLAERADLMVWLDLPTPVTMWRVIRRTARRARTQEELWNGNREPGLLRAVVRRDGIIRWAWRTRHKLRDSPPQLSHPGLRVVRLRSSGEVADWLAQLPR